MNRYQTQQLSLICSIYAFMNHQNKQKETVISNRHIVVSDQLLNRNPLQALEQQQAIQSMKSRQKKLQKNRPKPQKPTIRTSPSTHTHSCQAKLPIPKLLPRRSPPKYYAKLLSVPVIQNNQHPSPIVQYPAKARRQFQRHKIIVNNKSSVPQKLPLRFLL